MSEIDSFTSLQDVLNKAIEREREVNALVDGYPALKKLSDKFFEIGTALGAAFLQANNKKQ